MQKSVKIFFWSLLLQNLIIFGNFDDTILMVKVLPSSFSLHSLNLPANMICLLIEEDSLDPLMDFSALIMDLEIKKYLPVDFLLERRIPKTSFLLLKNLEGYQVHALLKYHLSSFKILMIDALAVSSNYRRQGLARLLLSVVENIAIVKKSKEIWVIVHRDNISAIRLYTSMGYVQDSSC